MQTSKNFGLSDSLIEAVKEALHPNQKKLDKNNNGKLDADDFKKLRGEETKHVDEAQTPQQKAAQAALATQRGEYDAGKKGGANAKSPQDMSDQELKDWLKRPMRKGPGAATWRRLIRQEIEKRAMKKPLAISKEEAEQTDEAMSPKQKAHSNRLKNNLGRKGIVFDPKSNFDAPNHKVQAVVSKDDKKETKNEVVQAKDKYEAMFKVQMKFHKMGYKVHDTKHKGMVKEEAISEADDAVAKQIAAKKEQMKKQIQQKIAQKQMSVMQKQAQKKIQNIKASNDKDVDDKEMKKKGKDEVEVNPELREAAVTGNERYGYHGTVQAKDNAERAKKYSAMHTKTKRLVRAAGHLRDARHPNKMVKHFLDSPHGRHIAGDPSDKHIISRFGHFKKSYKPHEHE